ncbi:MAG TPA: aminopeptidase P family protein [bacterium]|nr:aminopeptidase P family protein [bacterium]
MERIRRLRHLIAQQQLDAMLISKPENRRYLSGFTGSAGFALVTPCESLLLVDFRYVEQARAQAAGFEVVTADRQFIDTLAEVVAARRLTRIGFEADHLTVKQHAEFAQRLTPATLAAIDGVDRLRWVKDETELAHIARAAAIADDAFQHVLPLLRPGAVERDIALELEVFMRRHGAEREAFETIVASGPRSALPHGRAADRPLQTGDFVTLDFGATVEGYVSDCTRTVVIGEASAKQREVYEIVRAAHAAALAGIRPGLTGREADALARTVIAQAGYGEAFGHSLGHGVGLAVHEGPTLSPREDAVLAAGHVVTVEPGIYLPGWGGVRIENLVVITADGCRSLTGLPTELLVL